MVLVHWDVTGYIKHKLWESDDSQGLRADPVPLMGNKSHQGKVIREDEVRCYQGNVRVQVSLSAGRCAPEKTSQGKDKGEEVTCVCAVVCHCGRLSRTAKKATIRSKPRGRRRVCPYMSTWRIQTHKEENSNVEERQRLIRIYQHNYFKRMKIKETKTGELRKDGIASAYVNTAH